MKTPGGFSLLAVLATAVLAGHAQAADPGVPATWQEHKTSFSYFGITSNYSCSGMEGKVKQLLLLLGARADDVHVNAGACGPRDMPFGHSLNVDVRFSTLVPLDPTATPGATPPVAAQWTAVEIDPHRPSSMGEGDCELIEQMQELIARNFTSRNLDYRHTCTPHEVGVNTYAVHGEFLKAPKT
jgi:hypothetical protein